MLQQLSPHMFASKAWNRRTGCRAEEWIMADATFTPRCYLSFCNVINLLVPSRRQSEHTDKTNLKADREDWGEGGSRQTAPVNSDTKETNEILNPFKIKGKLINSPELIQEPPRMIQDLTEPFFDYFATKSNTNTSPHRHSDTPPEPGALIEVQSPSEGITHAGSIKFSRFGHTPQPPILRGGAPTNGRPPTWVWGGVQGDTASRMSRLVLAHWRLEESPDFEKQIDK